MNEDAEKRFLSRLKPANPTTGCIEYVGFKLNVYGHRGLSINNKLTYAHRYAWQRSRGKIPKKKCVLHTCDNPSCVNIEHLFLGTRKDNSRDKVNKRRHRWFVRGIGVCSASDLVIGGNPPHLL